MVPVPQVRTHHDLLDVDAQVVLQGARVQGDGVGALVEAEGRVELVVRAAAQRLGLLWSHQDD